MAKTKKAAKKESASVIDRDKVANYTVHDEKTAGGKRKSVDCNDEVADMLRGKDRDELKAVAKKHGFEDRLKAWTNLNDGMFRMNVGNVLRGVLRAKEERKTAKTKKAA